MGQGGEGGERERGKKAAILMQHACTHTLNLAGLTLASYSFKLASFPLTLCLLQVLLEKREQIRGKEGRLA